jgi:hypothetical protein
MPDSRDDSGRFQKGVSGNPGGKSPEREALRRYIVEAYGKEAIDGIAELARNATNEKVQLSARIWLAEQSIGKAVVAITGADGGPVKIDAEALDDLRALAERLKDKP